MAQPVQKGERKVVLTKWMLVIFTVVTVGYMILSSLLGKALPESFYMNFVLGLGTIGGAFAAGNVFEGRAKAWLQKAQADFDMKNLESTSSEATQGEK